LRAEKVKYCVALNPISLTCLSLTESDDLEEFDREFSGEIAIGHYCNPNFALEVGVGYFETDAIFQGVDPRLGSYREQDEITVTPVTLTGKAVHPMDEVELFGEVGVGFYFVSGEADASWTGLGGGSIHLDDDDTVFGFHLGVGANFNIAENLFLGLQGKYFWAEAEFAAYGFTLEADLDGFIVTATLGFRYPDAYATCGKQGQYGSAFHTNCPYILYGQVNPGVKLSAINEKNSKPQKLTTTDRKLQSNCQIAG